ncbi:MAG TPA: hypothetical protein VL068_13385, partial [Microthrixaceae bacterium]|nr:hypothetical protein [Microthrixaceae bacterium]
DDAYRLGLTPKKLFSTLQRYQPGSVGAASLRRVLARPDRAGPLPGSKFERILQRAIRDAGLPQPQRQCPVIDASGRIVAYIDLGWPEIWLGVEADSARWHDGMRNGRRDDLRDQLLMSLGWELFYVGWHAATHPDEFTQRLAETYEIRMQRARIEGFYQFQSGRGH